MDAGRHYKEDEMEEKIKEILRELNWGEWNGVPLYRQWSEADARVSKYCAGRAEQSDKYAILEALGCLLHLERGDGDAAIRDAALALYHMDRMRDKTLPYPYSRKVDISKWTQKVLSL